MKKEIYICDTCQNVLSDKGIAETHLSINFANHSGWVEKRNTWVHKDKVSGIKQFCDEKCLANYFVTNIEVKDYNAEENIARYKRGLN